MKPRGIFQPHRVIRIGRIEHNQRELGADAAGAALQRVLTAAVIGDQRDVLVRESFFLVINATNASLTVIFAMWRPP